MAITSRDGLVAAMAAGNNYVFQKGNVTASAGFYYSLFRQPGMPSNTDAAPATTGTTKSRTSNGALPIPAPSNTSYITSFAGCSTFAGAMVLADRLVEFGGLVANSTGTQSVSAVSLPARATSATDVELWLEVYTAGGATASATVTCQYTNQGGSGSRTATLVGGIPASGVPLARAYQFALQAGDTGVQSVQSLTLGTSTGTAGNIGLTLRRTLITGAVPTAGAGFSQGVWETDLQRLPDDACLEVLYLCNAGGTGIMIGTYGVAQG